MNQLTLEWIEANQVKTHVITDQQTTKHPGAFRIGRDPARCDLVLQHPTVSKLHIEIFFGSPTFYLRNLRDTNPPAVDQHRVTQTPIALHTGSQILLGELELKVTAIILAAAVAPTVVGSNPIAASHPGRNPVRSPAAGVNPQPAANLSYGLQCPKCHRVSSYHHLEAGCAWCGTSLAAAQSVLLLPDER